MSEALTESQALGIRFVRRQVRPVVNRIRFKNTTKASLYINDHYSWMVWWFVVVRTDHFYLHLPLINTSNYDFHLHKSFLPQLTISTTTHRHFCLQLPFHLNLPYNSTYHLYLKLPFPPPLINFALTFHLHLHLPYTSNYHFHLNLPFSPQLTISTSFLRLSLSRFFSFFVFNLRFRIIHAVDVSLGLTPVDVLDVIGERPLFP